MSEELVDEDRDQIVTRPLMRSDPPFLWDVLWDGLLWSRGYETRELAQAWLDGAQAGFNEAQGYSNR